MRITDEMCDELDGLRCNLNIIAKLIERGDKDSLDEAIKGAKDTEYKIFEWQLKNDATLLER